MNEISASETQIKRLYKESLECVKFLDQTTKEPADLGNLFSSRTITIRNRLCECCEKIIFLKPLMFGRKAEEIIWRKCFYEPILKIRRNIKSLNDDDRCFYDMHVTSATGYYCSLLVKLQQHFNLDMRNVADAPCVRLSWRQNVETGDDARQTREFALQISHRVFVYLGDLARYRQEFEKSTDTRLAQHYYHLALRLKPFHGQPHNQLGTLFANRNFGLDSALSYLRCIFSAESFMGADSNLCQLLDRNQSIFGQSCRHLPTTDLPAPIEKKSTDSKEQLFVGFLYAFKLFYDDSESSLDEEQDFKDAILCKVVHAFKDSLSSSALFTQHDGTVGCVLKIFVCQMILVKKLQDKASCKTSMALGFLASLLEILLDWFFGVLSNAMPERLTCVENENLKIAQSFPNKLTNGVHTETILNEPEPTKIPVHRSLLRRRQITDTGHSSGGDDDDDINSNSSDATSDDDDVVEVEEESESQNEASDEDLVDNVEPADQKSKVVTEALNGVSEADSQVEEFEQPIVDGEQQQSSKLDFIEPMLHIFCQHVEIFVTLKILCDWFRNDPTVIASIQGLNGGLWPKFANVLRFLPEEADLQAIFETNKYKNVSEFANIDWSTFDKWEQKRPLSEDVYLRGVPSLTQAHSCVDFESFDDQADDNQDMLLRIVCLRQFQCCLSAHIFLAQQKSSKSEAINTGRRYKSAVDSQKTDEVSKKERVMRNMAKLRIKDEMRNVEQLAWIPVYIVTDSRCLSLSLRHAQRLLACRKFVLLVPGVSVAALDDAKKTSVKAREASRWLEQRLRSGDKFIRVQKTTETTGDELPLRSKIDAFLKHDEAHGEEILGAIDCAAYLTRTVSSTITTVVCILTDDYQPKYADKDPDEDTVATRNGHTVEKWPPSKIYRNSVETAGIKGVTVDNVRNFSYRWFQHSGISANRCHNNNNNRRRGNP